MPQELRTFTVNLKSLDQDISDPIVAGAADANGRTFRVIFDEEAAAQFTDETNVYLSWMHKQLGIKGYNIFTKVSDDPITWEIKWPRSMLKKGDVLACIEIVDSVSIAASTNFIVHVLEDPNDGSQFVVSDDYTVFQNAVIELNCIGEQAKKQLRQQRIEFEDMMLQASRYSKTVEEIRQTADDAHDMAEKAYTEVKTGMVTREELDTAIKDAHHLKYEKVEELPVQGAEDTIYLLSLGDSAQEHQKYKEYIWTGDEFEQIGDTASDLANYVTLDQLYAAKDEVTKNAEKYSDDKLDEFKESFTKETTDTITKMGEEIQQEANNYAKGYADKVGDNVTKYVEDKLAEQKSSSDEATQNLQKSLDDTKKSLQDQIDANDKKTQEALDTKVDKATLGDLPDGQTITNYVDKKVSDLDTKVTEKIGDIPTDETIAEHIKKQVEEGQPDLNEFF